MTCPVSDGISSLKGSEASFPWEMEWSIAPGSLTEADKLEIARSAAAELNAAVARLAAVLPSIRHDELYRSDHGSWPEYLAEGLQLKPSLAAELIRVAQRLNGAGVSMHRVEEVGLHKLSIVSRQITPENQEQVLHDVRALDAVTLKERYQPARSSALRQTTSGAALDSAVTSADGSVTEAHGVSPQDSPEQLSDVVLDNAARPADASSRPRARDATCLLTLALVRAAQITGTADMDVNVEFIASEFLRTHPEPARPRGQRSPNLRVPVAPHP